ncbi:MAG: NUDIX domain-containing protein [Oscillospiraceae bacterium]|jgi:NAD+ diphosphatase|nr:NUDIX domain-containing protein [Oscillospiraceae bacterium]
MEFHYCAACGSKPIRKIIGDEGEMAYCDTCKIPLFPYFYTCIITLVVSETNEFALIQQYGINDRFICVAGYIKAGETAEETVEREVGEEVGLNTHGVQYVGSYYLGRKDQLMLGFAAKVDKADFKLSGEVDKACWFTEEEAEKVLPPNSIALNLFLDYVKQSRSVIA